MKLHGSMEVVGDELYIGGMSVEDLKAVYGTPLYVYDEKLISDTIDAYMENFCKNGVNNVAYAGKAFLTKYMCSLCKDKGLNLDVVSGGELYTAKVASFPMEKVIFHGNNKTYDEIDMALEYGVGIFVVDNFFELEMLNNMCQKYNKIQKIYFRVTPGIEAHTHEYIKTGQIDSKFGFPLVNGDFYKAVEKVKKYPNIELVGIHAHIGSQIFEMEPFLDEVELMLKLKVELLKKYTIEITDIDLGGGFGVYYTNEDHPLETSEICNSILEKANKVAEELNIELPKFIIEPGRSIVANAGTTLYTVGAIKNITGVRTYASVDGGMSDNIRPALYQAKYECFIANKMNFEQNELTKVSIAGKCCESGDILAEDVYLPNVESGDILAFTTTGAYGYSMSSNYNRIPKPAVVFVNNGDSKLICKRENFEDLLNLDVK